MEQNDNNETVSAPLEFPTLEVLPEWIDYNGHMNVAYYVLAFDQGVDAFLSYIGITPKYIEDQHASTFTLEIHVNYLRELSCGDSVRLTFQILDIDSKRVHFFSRMYHDKDGFLAATTEQILTHIDMRQRRTAPFPNHILQRLKSILSAHRTLPRPEQASSVISIRHK